MRDAGRQHKFDSFLETLVSTIVGFLVAMFTYQFIINPLYGLQSSVGESFGITCIFMTASILRQYVIRRLFNGRTIYQGIKDWRKERDECERSSGGRRSL